MDNELEKARFAALTEQINVKNQLTLALVETIHAFNRQVDAQTQLVEVKVTQSRAVTPMIDSAVRMYNKMEPIIDTMVEGWVQNFDQEMREDDVGYVDSDDSDDEQIRIDLSTDDDASILKSIP